MLSLNSYTYVMRFEIGLAKLNGSFWFFHIESDWVQCKLVTTWGDDTSETP